MPAEDNSDSYDRETADLIRKAADGEDDAISSLYRKYHDFLHRLAHKRLGSPIKPLQATDDFVNSVLYETIRSLERFEYRSEAEWKAYLSKLLNRKIGQEAKAQGTKKRGGHEEFLNGTKAKDAINAHPASDPTPSANISNREMEKRVRIAMERLDKEAREVLKLKSYDKLTYKQIGEKWNCSEEAARKKVKRAEKAFGRIYEQLGWD